MRVVGWVVIIHLDIAGKPFAVGRNMGKQGAGASCRLVATSRGFPIRPRAHISLHGYVISMVSCLTVRRQPNLALGY